MPCGPAQVSGRGHGMTGRRASLGHLDLATHPGAGMLDRLTRSWVLRLSRLEEAKNVLRARCRPQSEELVIRIGEGPAAADRHEAMVPDLREDHGRHSCCLHPPTTLGRLPRDQARPQVKRANPGDRYASSSTTQGKQAVTAPSLLRRKWPARPLMNSCSHPLTTGSRRKVRACNTDVLSCTHTSGEHY